MSSKRYPEEFKIEAVKQVTERGHAVADVASRIGVSQHGLYEWLKRYSIPEPERLEQQSQSAEIRRRGCKNFCVNGHLAGNCRAPRSDDGRNKGSSTQGVAGQPAG